MTNFEKITKDSNTLALRLSRLFVCSSCPACDGKCHMRESTTVGECKNNIKTWLDKEV